MPLTVVTAEPGAGKTSFVLAYLEDQARRGRRIGGVLAPAAFERSRRVGYDLVDVATQQRWVSCRTKPVGADWIRQGRYSFDPEGLHRAAGTIVSAVRSGDDLVAVDEVGPLEVRGDGLARAVRAALRDLQAPQELILVVRGSLLEEVVRAFPSSLWETHKQICPPWPAVGGSVR